MKNLCVWVSKLKKYKFKEFQIYFSFNSSPEIFFNIALPRKYNQEYILNVDILNIFGLCISKNYKADYAGFRVTINIFGLNICYSYLDSRHWDDDTDDWCKYDIDTDDLCKYE
jgi:hypothetical protein